MKHVIQVDDRKPGKNLVKINQHETLHQKEGKVVAVHVMKAYRGKGGIPPHILNLDTRWKLVVNFTSGWLYLLEGTPYALTSPKKSYKL